MDTIGLLHWTNEFAVVLWCTLPLGIEKQSAHDQNSVCNLYFLLTIVVERTTKIIHIPEHAHSSQFWIAMNNGTLTWSHVCGEYLLLLICGLFLSEEFFSAMVLTPTSFNLQYLQHLTANFIFRLMTCASDFQFKLH